jgi:hypothetical protein
MTQRRQTVHRTTGRPKADGLVRRVTDARERGLIESGPANVRRTPPEELKELERHAREVQGQRGPEQSVSVTIRLPVATLDALRLAAKRLGVRGYQTLMKMWIDERLRDDDLVSRRAVQEALQPVMQLAESSASYEPVEDSSAVVGEEDFASLGAGATLGSTRSPEEGHREDAGLEA